MEEETQNEPIVNALAVIGSAIFPGLGHAMKGRFVHALAFAVGFIASLYLILLLIGIVLAPIYWGLALYDAYGIPIKKPKPYK